MEIYKENDDLSIGDIRSGDCSCFFLPPRRTDLLYTFEGKNHVTFP